MEQDMTQVNDLVNGMSQPFSLSIKRDYYSYAATAEILLLFLLYIIQAKKQKSIMYHYPLKLGELVV